MLYRYGFRRKGGFWSCRFLILSATMGVAEQ